MKTYDEYRYWVFAVHTDQTKCECGRLPSGDLACGGLYFLYGTNTDEHWSPKFYVIDRVAEPLPPFEPYVVA